MKIRNSNLSSYDSKTLLPAVIPALITSEVISKLLPRFISQAPHARENQVLLTFFPQRATWVLKDHIKYVARCADSRSLAQPLGEAA